jgi:hypothetical protein
VCFAQMHLYVGVGRAQGIDGSAFLYTIRFFLQSSGGVRREPGSQSSTVHMRARDGCGGAARGGAGPRSGVSVLHG